MHKAASLLILAIGLGLQCAAGAKEAPKADNSAQNTGATEKESVTAEKQTNHKSDLETLANIRKSIVEDKSLSMDAKNVKVLFANGCATLRGPVDGDDEKAKVEQLTKECPGVSSVKNLLTVSHKKH